MKNNFDKFTELINDYFLQYHIRFDYLSEIHDASASDPNANEPVIYLYNSAKELQVINMDIIARIGYKAIKKPFDTSENPINSADAFLINSNNDWYFIEFKDSTIKSDKQSLKDNILKKAYSNWYMILDMLYEMKDSASSYSDFYYDSPIQFAREHVSYILVCSTEKNPLIYRLIKDSDLSKSTYTPPFMSRLRGYLFKDAYIYTEEFFERKFVSNFVY